MGVRRLTATLETLRNQPSLDAADVAMMREASGAKVSRTEKAMVDAFVREIRPHLTPDATSALLEDFGIHNRPIAQLSEKREIEIDIREASGLVHLDDGQMLIADDERGVYLMAPDGSSDKLLSSKDYKELRGLEGICLSSDGQTAYVVSEGSRNVYAMALSQDGGELSLDEPQKLGKLPRLGNVANKGWEGLEVLPGRFCEDGLDRLVAVHEGNPRRVGVFSLPDLEEPHIIDIPDELDSQLSDIADIAIHPETGHVFLLSDESQCIAELALEMKHSPGPGALLESLELRALGTYDLPGNRSNKPEGLSFHGPNSLFVIGDGDHRLLELSVEYP